MVDSGQSLEQVMEPVSGLRAAIEGLQDLAARTVEGLLRAMRLHDVFLLGVAALRRLLLVHRRIAALGQRTEAVQVLVRRADRRDDHQIAAAILRHVGGEGISVLPVHDLYGVVPQAVWRAVGAL